MKNILFLINKGIRSVIKSAMTLMLVFIGAVAIKEFLLFCLQVLTNLKRKYWFKDL